MLLAPNIIKYPTLAEKEETATFYRERKGFPRIIGNVIMFIFIYVKHYTLMFLFFSGAIDGSHI